MHRTNRYSCCRSRHVHVCVLLDNRTCRSDQSGDQGALFRVLCMAWMCDQHCLAHLPNDEYKSRFSGEHLPVHDALKAMGRVRILRSVLVCIGSIAAQFVIMNAY